MPLELVYRNKKMRLTATRPVNSGSYAEVDTYHGTIVVYHPPNLFDNGTPLFRPRFETLPLAIRESITALHDAKVSGRIENFTTDTGREPTEAELSQIEHSSKVMPACIYVARDFPLNLRMMERLYGRKIFTLGVVREIRIHNA